VILGLVIGYDVHIKVRDASERRGFDMPSLEAQYGSAAAAARLMGLSPAGITNALSIAASTANTLSEVRAGDTLTNAKGTAEALAVRAGTFAGLLSKAGIDYPPTMMDGEFSYKSLVSRGLKEEILRKRTGDYEIMKSSMKMWPSIGTSQAPIAAALQFREKGIKASDIKSVVLHLSSFGYDQQKGFLSHNITTREHADHSCPYVVARAFLDGDVREEDFVPARFRDPVALAFMEKISVLEDPELTKNGADILGCRLEITLNNGASQKIDMRYAPGSVQNPATPAQVEHKFFDLAEGTLGAAGARRAQDAILSLHTQRDLKVLIAALNPPKAAKK
jgi:2-methylcitrate dehydratase